MSRQVKKGEVWDVEHTRKGMFTIQFKADYDLDESEFIGGTVVDGTARGLTTYWEPGEPIDMRSSFLRLVKKVGEPLKTTEERHAHD